MRLLVEPTTRPLSHELVIPNSKYHAHRALILASLADGPSRILGLTHAQHVGFTIKLLRDLGVGVRIEGESIVVEGHGPYHPVCPTVSAGSSGTTLPLASSARRERIERRSRTVPSARST